LGKSKRLNAVPNVYLTPFDGTFQYEDWLTAPPVVAKKKKLKSALKKEVKKLSELQRVMYADNRYSLLLVFQAMDAAGKDSTIRSVMSGINPAGCQVFSFKQPTAEELDHDFFWRTNKRLPERGRIGVFNRSYYEEVLVVRVHPSILESQRLPAQPDVSTLWNERYESIRNQEQHLARNGTVILKFWLNVSKEEQKNRFLSRLNEPEKHWKFSAGDIREREHWNEYMQAYQQAIAETSRHYAPWYAIPADNKPYMRYTVARIIRKTLESLNLNYPLVDEEEKARFEEMKGVLSQVET
jgi:PPK2 family polyphosphate:nucleotide phosphotransferase